VSKTRYEFFIERLKELMANKNLNQSTLAQKLGISRSTVTNWFSRSQNISLDNIALIAIHFKCTTDYFLGLEDEFGNKTY